MKRMNAYDKAILRYCVGAIIATLLTTGIYIVTVNGLFDSAFVVGLVVLLAASVQLVVQLYFFFHITEEKRPRWQLHSMWFSVAMIVVVVVGSIWIMKNLDYNMGMSAEQMHQYMLEENKKGF